MYSADLLAIIVNGHENPSDHRAVGCERWWHYIKEAAEDAD